MTRMSVACVVAMLAAPSAVALPEALFDFEDLPAFSEVPLTLTDSGQEIVIDRGAGFAAVELADPSAPAEIGSRFLRVPLDFQDDPLTISFTGGVTGVAFDLGLTRFTDIPVTIQIDYFFGQGGTGGLIQSSSVLIENNWTDGDSPQRASFSFLAPTDALGSVVLRGDAGFFAPFGYAIDNIAVTIPTPAATLSFVIAGSGMTRRRR